MNIAALKEILEVQQFIQPALNERYVKGCERFGYVFDTDEHLFAKYTRSIFTPTAADIILDLYKRRK